MNFSRGIGGLCHTCGNSGGVGGGASAPCKNGKSRGVGGSVVGVWIFSGTTQYHLKRPREKIRDYLSFEMSFFQKSDIIWSPGHYPYGYNCLISNKRDWNIIVSLNCFKLQTSGYYN